MKQRSLILFLFITICQPCFSQIKLVSDTLANTLHNLAKETAPENIYLQTSKGIYESGEDLWFKAYVLDAQSFVPSTLSQTLYLQLINESTNKALWQENYEIQNGFADGQVYLPDSIAEGDYLLEGFTANSFYVGKGQFEALRKVRIVKNYKSITNPVVVPAKNKTVIQFNVFPEGGKLISDIPAKLAFKAVDENGEPYSVLGTLFQEGQPLKEFKSQHAGMGSVTFTPMVGKNYHIKLSEPAIDSIFSLPKIYASGISLSLKSSDSTNLIFTIKRTGGNASKVYLRGQLRGQTACIASGTLDKKLIIKLPLKQFTQQGITEFTLFDENMLPIAERLVYLHPQKKLFIKAELSKSLLGLREKVTLKIKVNDENGVALVAHLGVSIFDKLYQNPKDSKNILTHYYLSSQLKGRIYSPAYYFDEKNKQRDQALDLLLLTQGWRNYVWSEENLYENISKAKPFLLDGIAGTVRFTKKLKQAPSSKAQFIMAFSPDEKGNAKNSIMITTDSVGKFTISSQELKASQGNYLYLRPISQPELQPRISILDTPFAAINKWMGTKERIYPQANSYLNNMPKALKTYETRPTFNKLNEVVVKARGTLIFRDKYLGKLDSMAKADLNTDFVCVYDFPPKLNCFHKHDHNTKKRKPIEGEVVSYDVDENDNVLGEDYPYTYWYATKTKKYQNPYLNFTEVELLKRNNLSKIKGYYAQKEFYQPNYDKEPDEDSLPDARNTLLWAPKLITDTKGEATLSFFSSDINTEFLGIIEGVSADGLLGLGGFEFMVRKTSTP